MLPEVCAKGCTKLPWHSAMRNVAECPKFAIWVLQDTWQSLVPKWVFVSSMVRCRAVATFWRFRDMLSWYIIAHHGVGMYPRNPTYHVCSDDPTWNGKVYEHLCAFDFCIGVQLWYPGQESSWVMHEFWGFNDCEDRHLVQWSGIRFTWWESVLNKAGWTDMHRYNQALHFKQASLQGRHFGCMHFFTLAQISVLASLEVTFWYILIHFGRIPKLHFPHVARGLR